ncbi:hypothetical protein SAMN05444157_1659 [Frankineae bacterium MT45]|nr:hypothetical protein SAMN05444157_1659 [Frankineae bacterium MT45]
MRGRVPHDVESGLMPPLWTGTASVRSRGRAAVHASAVAE